MTLCVCCAKRALKRGEHDVKRKAAEISRHFVLLFVIHKYDNPILEVKKVESDGAVVYARQNVKRGQIVGQYHGRLLREEENCPYLDRVVSLREFYKVVHDENITPHEMRS
ncbi:hypothetical protein ROZALSC1DRAFT_21599 [Rozella allomycis CSF55]|uniref:Uncharacterized protein n=1 Tax=Rozella allomycis (strain CSF55) TaxID=988480 RepID=A0A4P9YNJ3_ROZAC|nr:hypothetical protein ROZALSC1DRAFT_21599 [Rozella allomycis CSF55]